MLHRPVTGPDIHPPWCERGHVCSAERGGDHRSAPQVVDTDRGRLVLTRIQTVKGAGRMEIRAVVELPTDSVLAEAAARRVVADLCTAVSPTRRPAPTR